ncbi:MAG: MopE-related protein, partial [Myxococcota bacterium]|nr:MopE-related protein [Myxococcota bacterium]
MIAPLLWLTPACPGGDDDATDDDDISGDDDTTGDDDSNDDDSADDDDATVADDGDGDGYPAAEDCNDSNAAVYPGAEQACDGVMDNDCDGIIDSNETDADVDGFTDCDGDCDDLNGQIHPGAFDRCDDDLDNDCDGTVDEDGYVQMDIGRDHSCGLTCLGELICWGDNST